MCKVKNDIGIEINEGEKKPHSTHACILNKKACPWFVHSCFLFETRAGMSGDPLWNKDVLINTVNCTNSFSQCSRFQKQHHLK